jgi:hypothetical protein
MALPDLIQRWVARQMGLVTQGEEACQSVKPLWLQMEGRQLTVRAKQHLEHIYEKFGVQTRLSAVLYALEPLGDRAPGLALPFQDPVHHGNGGPSGQ